MALAVSAPAPVGYGYPIVEGASGFRQRFGSFRPDDVQVLPKFVSAAKSAAKLWDRCGCKLTSIARGINSTGLLSVISIPFAAKDVTRDVRAAHQASGWKKVEYSIKAIANLSDIGVSITGFAGGIKAVTEGSRIGSAIALGTAAWTTPVTVAGMALLMGCTLITRGLALFRTTKTLMSLKLTRDEQAADTLKATMAQLVERDETYLKEHFKVEKSAELKEQIAAFNDRLVANEDDAQADATRLVKALRGRAKVKMGRDVAAVATMIAAFVGMILLTFTSATPVGWVLIGAVAVSKIATFVFDKVYPRTAVK